MRLLPDHREKESCNAARAERTKRNRNSYLQVPESNSTHCTIYSAGPEHSKIESRPKTLGMQSNENQYIGLVEDLHLPGAGNGLLLATSFVAKDLFDVEGFVTGAGNPDWKRTHLPAKHTAVAIQRLLDAGATLIGKALTDELALSLDGINTHYGTPTNPQFPERIPGGSSSGSASATAAGYCDFGLGTDTVGSIRVPSSYCGLFGIRPTHGSIDPTGAIPLGPSFDTVAWCARSARILTQVGQVLLPPATGPQKANFTEALLLTDCFALMPNDNLRLNIRRQAVDLLSRHKLNHDELTLPANFLTRCMNVFNAIRGYEATQLHSKWIDEAAPAFGPGIRERFEQSRLVTKTQSEEARHQLSELRTEFMNLVGEKLLVLPTVCDWPPHRDASQEALQTNRITNVKISVLASITGAPQITVPVTVAGDEPPLTGRFGISFMAPRAYDRELLHLVQELNI